ncbi:MAG: NUDIX hydrolase [Candidatus Parcubacteria bacterium]|nr:NUDIX hydrolase [Candidatus Parcubacteria bacterium]
MENNYYSIKTHFLVKIILKKGNTFLILKNNKEDINNLNVGWESPGGHLEENENIEQALFRELKEETNLTDIKILSPIHSFLFDTGKENSLGGVIYLAEYVAGEVYLDNKEHCMYKWTTLNEIELLEGTKGLLQEFDAYKKFISNIKTLFV